MKKQKVQGKQKYTQQSAVEVSYYFCKQDKKNTVNYSMRIFKIREMRNVFCWCK